MKHFRQLVVNSVMAKDIVDPKLKALRNARWETAFKDLSPQQQQASNNAGDTINCKATIVIKYLIQASDVAHIMQHWHIYRKWKLAILQRMLRGLQGGSRRQHQPG